MYVVIKNTGAQEGIEVNQTKAFTGVSAVNITLSDGKVYNWAPGESKTLAEPFASEALSVGGLVEISRS